MREWKVVVLRKGQHLCTLAVVIMATFTTLVAGAVGLRDPCGALVAGGAVLLWGLALYLAQRCGNGGGR